jgi:hypothetical protein
MPRSTSQQLSSSSELPDFGVQREIISKYFSPPLPRSTFYDLVNKGKIVPIKGLKGFYRLNDSLRRLGLREVAQLPHSTGRSMEELVRLVFSLIDPTVFPEPSWLLCVEIIDSKDLKLVGLLVEKHAECVEELPSFQEKHAYLQGVLDATHLEELGERN